MCGFVGVFFDDHGVVPDKAPLAAMRDLLEHRGPDMAGLRVGDGYGLGFRRLSILDLRPEANQPMRAPDADVWITFNGEIYNHNELRDRLVSMGHTFATTCDTEVLLHAYLQWGQGCVDHLEGMYGFAIRDERDGTTVIARDPVGIKPLYYARMPKEGPHGGAGGWLVASESKAFAAWPGFELRFDPESLAELLAFRFVAGESSPMLGVKRILPGHVGVLRDGRWTFRRFFDVRDTWCAPGHVGGTFEERARDLEAVIAEAVKAELQSDVPLGTQLSGGVDSGLVTALAAQARDEAIKTFTVFFRGETSDERPEARKVSDRYGTERRELELVADRFVDMLPELTWHLDEPLNHPNSAAVYSLCKRAKDEVTVLLSGDGPDELLGGYERYGTALRALSVSDKVPGAVRRGLAALPRFGLQGRGEPLERALRGDADTLMLTSSAFVMPFELADMGVAGDAIGGYRRKSLATATGSPLKKMLIVDIETYMEAVLGRQDKMAMAASVETRVPYLERRVIEAVGPLSDEDRRHGRTGKWILRNIASRHLDRPVVPDERKVGFAVPLRHWLQEDPRLTTRLDAVRSGQARVAAYVPEKLVATMTEGLAAGRRMETELAWMLVSLDLYLEALASGKERGASALAAAQSGKDVAEKGT